VTVQSHELIKLIRKKKRNLLYYTLIYISGKELIKKPTKSEVFKKSVLRSAQSINQPTSKSRLHFSETCRGEKLLTLQFQYFTPV